MQKLVIGALVGIIAWQEYKLLRMEKQNEEVADLLVELADSIDADNETIGYLLKLFNKYEIPLDEFEAIALGYHNIRLREVEED